MVYEIRIKELDWVWNKAQINNKQNSVRVRTKRRGKLRASQGSLHSHIDKHNHVPPSRTWIPTSQIPPSWNTAFGRCRPEDDHFSSPGLTLTKECHQANTKLLYRQVSPQPRISHLPFHFSENLACQYRGGRQVVHPELLLCNVSERPARIYVLHKICSISWVLLHKIHGRESLGVQIIDGWII